MYINRQIIQLEFKKKEYCSLMSRFIFNMFKSW